MNTASDHILIFVFGIDVLLWLLIAIFVIRKTQRISALYRTHMNPPFPVSGEEIWNSLEKINSPADRFSAMLDVFKSRTVILRARSTGNKELDKLLSDARSLLSIWVLLIVFSALALIYVGTHTK